MGATLQRKLNRKMADTASPGVNQYLLTGFQPGHLKQGLPGRQCRQGHRAGSHQIKLIRDDGQLVSTSQCVLRISTTAGRKAHHTHHPVARGQGGHALSNGDDLTGNVVPRRPGQPVFDLSGGEPQPLPGFPVNRVQTGAMHSDNHFTLPGLRHRSLRHLKHLPLTKLAVDHVLHED